MPSYSPSTISRIADINLGIRVDKAALAIAGITTKPLFTVTGGRILVRALVGEVTVAIQDQANAMKFVSTPTVGAVADMCAAGATQNMAIGGLISLPGTTIATAAHVTTTTAVGAVPACNTAGIIVAAGVIGVATAADNTGSMKFSLWYVPLDDGAYVTAV
jgi:hypothetical protein